MSKGYILINLSGNWKMIHHNSFSKAREVCVIWVKTLKEHTRSLHYLDLKWAGDSLSHALVEGYKRRTMRTLYFPRFWFKENTFQDLYLLTLSQGYHLQICVKVISPFLIFPHSVHEILSYTSCPFWKGQREKQAAGHLFNLISNFLYSEFLIKWKLCAFTGPIFELYIFSDFAPCGRGRKHAQLYRANKNVMTQQLCGAGNLLDSRWRIKDHKHLLKTVTVF